MVKLRKMSINEYKETELKILLAFDKFCKENELRYYLAYGTLLGAVRHKGFIPWDDDIDVVMPKPDYDRLLNIFPSDYESKLYQDKYWLCSFEHNNNIRAFSKIIDTTTIIEEPYVKKDHRIGLWIDIFPVSGLPADDDELKKFYKIIYLCKKISLLNQAKIGKGHGFIKTYFVKPLCILIVKSINIHDFIAKRIFSMYKKYPYATSKYVGVTWGDGIQEKMLKSDFEKSGGKITFEGHVFPTYVDWDNRLQAWYGNYMILPPKEKREPHIMSAFKKEKI